MLRDSAGKMELLGQVPQGTPISSAHSLGPWMWPALSLGWGDG
jgi:hypothetical protein